MVENFLTEKGYKELTPTRWHLRLKESSHQIVVMRLNSSFEVEITFKNRLGSWTQVKYYSLNETDLIKQLSAIEHAMFNTITELFGHPMNSKGVSE